MAGLIPISIYDEHSIVHHDPSCPNWFLGRRRRVTLDVPTWWESCPQMNVYDFFYIEALPEMVVAPKSSSLNDFKIV